MSPPPLSWWQLLVLMMGMLWLAVAEDGAEVCSSSESLLLEPSSLLEDEELLESEELSLLLSWSMTRASAINSVHSGICTNKEEDMCDNYVTKCITIRTDESCQELLNIVANESH